MLSSHETCLPQRPEVLQRHGEGGVLGGASDSRRTVRQLLPGHTGTGRDRGEMESKNHRRIHENI